MIFDVATFVVAFVIALVLYPPFIRVLRRLRQGQVIQAELPDSHQKKAGTPTGGGILFAILGVVGGLLAALAGHAGAWPSVAGLVAGGLIGFADDRSKLRVGSLGIPARLKLPIQLLLAVPVAAIAMSQGGAHQFLLPWPVWLLFPSAVLVPRAPAGEKAVAMSLAGGLVAFLLYNRYPARVFMGDTGSLALGFALAAMAVQQGFLILLPLLALVFVLETLSVIIQVAYFKASGGRRVFKMAPIHYTFHHEGWSENRIALSFWGAGLVSALAAAGVARLIT